MSCGQHVHHGLQAFLDHASDKHASALLTLQQEPSMYSNNLTSLVLAQGLVLRCGVS